MGVVLRKLAVTAVVLLAGATLCPAHVVAAPTPLVVPSFPAAPAAGMLRYVDVANGWSIDYPDGWRVDPANPAFVQFQDPEDGALVGVHVKPTELPLNTVVDETLAYEVEYDRRSGLTTTVTSRRQIALSDGTPAVDVVIEISPGGRAHHLYTVKGGKAYTVNAETYVTSWDKYSSDFDRMLASFLPPS